MYKSKIFLFLIVVALTSCNEEDLLNEIRDLQAALHKQKEPVNAFKLFSESYWRELKPEGILSEQKEDDIDALQKKLAVLSNPKKLIAAPETSEVPYTVSLDLVFFGAPKTASTFKVYVAGVHAEKESGANYLLATDDLNRLKTILSESKIEPPVFHEFSVPREFPILYLGNGVFMLPKEILAPRREKEDSSTKIKLEYNLNAGVQIPLGYKEYVGNCSAHYQAVKAAAL